MKSSNNIIDNTRVIVIAGPTASGKSDVANLLASKINGEIISADSMQIYKGMDVGTGKISGEEMLVDHWGLNIVDPDQPYSAALFQKYARDKINEINDRSHTPIICGGTGFYIRSVVDDYNFSKGDQTGNPIREKWEKYLEENNAHDLWLRLNEVDKDSASVIHENNSVRVIRALELYENGDSYFKQLNNLAHINQYYDTRFFALKVDPEILRKRIDSRVDNMLDKGLIDEVKDLLNRGYRQYLTASSAIGYKEFIPYLDGEISMSEAIEKVKIHSHQYAKRQRSWFRNDSRYTWIPYNEINPTKAVEFIENSL